MYSKQKPPLHPWHAIVRMDLTICKNIRPWYLLKNSSQYGVISESENIFMRVIGMRNALKQTLKAYMRPQNALLAA